MMTIWGMGLLFMFCWYVCLWYVICELCTCVWRAEVNGDTFFNCSPSLLFIVSILFILFLFLYSNFIVLLFKYIFILCIYLFCLHVYLSTTCMLSAWKGQKKESSISLGLKLHRVMGIKSSTLNGWLANKTLDSPVSTSFLYLNCASELSLHY